MQLTSIRITNFQAFEDSGEIRFSSGFNLVVGQNNSGKSSLLKALLPNLPDDRHRTPERWETARIPVPEVLLKFWVGRQELLDWPFRFGDVLFPIDPRANDVSEAYTRSMIPEEGIIFEVISRSGAARFTSQSYPSHCLFASPSPSGRSAGIFRLGNGTITFSSQNDSSDNLPEVISNAWAIDMFYFSAERMNIGQSGINYADRLQPNAGNLPNVLNYLKNERGKIFDRMLDHIREIFPTVGNITVPITRANQLEIRIWPSAEMNRSELSFPLASSGTGLSQVISMLTAIMTIDQAVIIIDEINSFLHPAAVKSLLRIMQAHYKHHQFIISTHAPEVISSCNPKTIHLVRRRGYQSTVTDIELERAESLHELAGELGISMADVFAADRIVWVEGQTEELCFPILHQTLVGPLPPGLIISSVTATGDFSAKKRDRSLVFEIYRRLSSATARLVTVVFSFDSERLTDADKDELRKQADGKLHFLPRRHLECYLIDAPAIAAFLTLRDTAASPTIGQVEAALMEAAEHTEFKVAEWGGKLDDAAWLSKVDAAKLINAVCENLTHQRVTFRKKNDSLNLMQHLAANNPAKLGDLKSYVGQLVSAAMGSP